MSGSKDQINEQRTYIPWDSTRKEAWKMGLVAWTQFFHMPYQEDWQQARQKAIERRWNLLE